MLNILVVDDHPLIVDSYILAISKYSEIFKDAHFDRAVDCFSANELIQGKLNNDECYDVAIIDYSIPSDTISHLKDGEDVIHYLKNVMPKCKNIMLTGHSEVLRVFDIVKHVQPDGFSTKYEITPQVFVELVEYVWKGGIYRSKIVQECIQKVEERELLLDDCNRQILFHLAKGYRLQDLENYIPLAGPTIKKRLAKMKKAYDAKDTAHLIQKAIKHGYL